MEERQFKTETEKEEIIKELKDRGIKAFIVGLNKIKY